MNLARWLDRIEAQAPNTIQLGLDRVQQAANAMGLVQPSCPVITVAGTNGKGTSVALLETCLSTAGYRVGSYSSPHLYTFNERIKLSGQAVEDELIIDSFDHVFSRLSQHSLTYFEFITLAAFHLFMQSDCDLWVLEVGLGGRLDAVNIINPDIALITTIDLDHQGYLGNTLESIAREKAGIMRPGCPVVCSDPNPPNSIREHADAVGAGLTLASTYPASCPPTQILPSNAAGVLEVLKQLSPQFPVSETIIRHTLETLSPPGRQQHLNLGCDWVLDVGHNPAALKQLKRHLDSMPVQGKTRAVFSMLNDKDISGCIAAISSVIDEWHIAPIECVRGASAENLTQSVKAFSDKPCYNHPSLEQAIVAVKTASNSLDRVVVFGSFYTVAAVEGV